MARATPTKKKTPVGTPHKTTLKAISKEKITPRKPRPGAQAITPTAKPISKTTETTPRKSRPEATASKPIAKATKSGGSMTAAYDKTKLSCGPNGDGYNDDMHVPSTKTRIADCSSTLVDRKR
jgi:hypothetical protein